MRSAALGNSKLVVLGDTLRAVELAIRQTDLEWNDPLMQQGIKRVKELVDDLVIDHGKEA
jgi:hypothetical protein